MVAFFVSCMCIYLHGKFDVTTMANVRMTSDLRRFILSIITIAFSMAYVFMITFLEIPEANQRTVDTVLGGLIILNLGTVYTYNFGSSQGSADKEKRKQIGTENNEPGD